MAILFKDWLDMFINNGFNSENITHWPEEGSEPEVVEELPEDPEFGKIYCLEYSSGADYYTIDANNNWINLSEGVQPGGIVEVDDLPYLPEDGVVYHLVGSMYAEDGYYVGLNFPGNAYASSGEVSKYIKLDYLDYIVGSDPAIPYAGNCRIIERNIENGIWTITSGGVFAYATGYTTGDPVNIASGDPSDANNIVNFLREYPEQYVSSNETAAAYFKDYNSSGEWNAIVSSGNNLLEPDGYDFKETVLGTGDLYIAMFDSNSHFVSMSSGALFGWKDSDEYLHLGNHEGNLTDLLTDVVFSSGGEPTTGIYYPSSDRYNYDNYPFIAFTAQQAELSSGEEYIATSPNFVPTRLRPDWLYYYYLSSGDYRLAGTSITSYGIADILTNSNITDIFYRGGDTYGHYQFYTKPYNSNSCGYWFEPDWYSGNSNYISHTVWNGSALDTDVACRFLNCAYSGGEYGSDYMDQAFFPLHSSSSYSATYEAVTIPDIHTPMIFLTGSFDGDRYAGAMATNKIYYRYIGQYGGDDVRVGEATLPAAGSSTTITIDGVTYTISRAA